MEQTNATDGYLPELQANVHVLEAMARSYRDDPDFRTRCDTEPRATLAGAGLELDVPGMDFQVRANTAEVFHVVLPADPNSALEDSMIQHIAGGSTASTAACAGSAGTFSCPVSTASTGGTLGSVGSAGGD